MELKLVKKNKDVEGLEGFNRTFMELKYGKETYFNCIKLF